MNIAIFCPNWVGDVVMATPALRAIRVGFPDARITYVVKGYVADVLEGSPHADDWLVYDARAWTLGVARRLRRRRIDQAVLLTNSFRSAAIARLAGARRIVGYARDGRSWLLTDKLQALTDGKRYVPSPVIDYYLEAAYRVGCPKESYRMELWTRPEDEAAAEGLWERLGLTGRRPVVLLNPGAAFGAAKFWPTEHFSELAARLVDERGARVLVLCGPNEREIAREIAARSERPEVASLADEPLSIGLSKACVRRADLLVTTDSGPRHFAPAFDVPVVTLFGPTHIEWTITYYEKEIHLQHKLDCGPCQERVCPLGHHQCMRELRPDEVFEAAARLLDGPSGRG